MPITVEIIHMCIFKQSTNAYLVLSDSHIYFHLAATSILHIYDHLCIPCFKDTLPGIEFYMNKCMYVPVYTHIHIYIHRDTY